MMQQQQQRLSAAGRAAAGPRPGGACRPAAPRRRATAAAALVEPGATVLVAGATGGVGQLVTAKLVERGYRVRAMVRDRAKAARTLGEHPLLELVVADARDAASLAPAVAGVDAVVCATGTTAFPSARWEGNNGPRPTDLVGPTNLIDATPRSVGRFVFVTSAGVEREKEMPWRILNLFGVLTLKRQAEAHLQASGLPYTILRPSRLTDGPYTSYDLNTLLKGVAGNRQAVTLSGRDDLLGEASRIATAEAAVQALTLPEAENRAFALASTAGQGPGGDASAWRELFARAAP